MVFGCLIGIGAGIFLVTIDDPGEADAWFWGWLCIIFCGLAGVVWSRQLFRAEPVLEIDSNGILWRRWSDDPFHGAPLPAPRSSFSSARSS